MDWGWLLLKPSFSRKILIIETFNSFHSAFIVKDFQIASFLVIGAITEITRIFNKIASTVFSISYQFCGYNYHYLFNINCK